VTVLLAVACGVAVANIYFAQPLLVTIGHDFGLTAATIGVVVTITQIGYGIGLFLVVPLGDLVDPRRLAVIQLLLLAAALLVVGSAGTPVLLLAGFAAVGLLAVVTQTLVAYAASLADPARRGRVVGAVTSGIVIGILLARVVSGVVADLAGWRAVYLASAVLTVVVTVALHRVLPMSASPRADLNYRQLLVSMLKFFLQERVFRTRGVLAMLIFAAFSALWSSIALPLTEMSLSHTAIGAFGLAGVAGATAAIPAGWLNDRGFSRWTTGIALLLLAFSWVPIAFTRQTLWSLVIGVVLLDLAVQAVHVTNQSLIYAVRPDAGSRVIGGYMVFYSVGSGVGAIASTTVYSFAGWVGVCVLGAAISVTAFSVWLIDQFRSIGG
jgi:predicted MFS family arabinose efflux permease